MVVLLIKAHPQCIQVKAGKQYPELSAVPFIQQIHPLIVNELQIEQEISLLSQISQKYGEIGNPVGNNLNCPIAPNRPSLHSTLGSLSEVFGSWANLRISGVLSAQIQGI